MESFVLPLSSNQRMIDIWITDNMETKYFRFFIPIYIMYIPIMTSINNIIMSTHSVLYAKICLEGTKKFWAAKISAIVTIIPLDTYTSSFCNNSFLQAHSSSPINTGKQTRISISSTSNSLFSVIFSSKQSDILVHFTINSIEIIHFMVINVNEVKKS